MNVLLLLAHSIAEYDDVRMLTDLGYDVFSIGAYTNPHSPGDDKRPPLPQAVHHADLEALVPDQMRAKEHLPSDLIDWADVIVAHHYVDSWLGGQWSRIKPRNGKRVVWRTCGQSDLRLESAMAPLRSQGLEIVRYSPQEQVFFQPTGAWAGQDALIRFGKYLDDYGPWDPDTVQPYVANVTQDMVGRGDWCGLSWYQAATDRLDARPAGPGSDKLPGGLGALSYDQLRQYLSRAAAYVYTGTMPASYTLGLIEAMASGVPIVAMGGHAWMGPVALWEADQLVSRAYDSPGTANDQLRDLLTKASHGYQWHDPFVYGSDNKLGAGWALRQFDVRLVGQQWVQFLGDPS